MMNFLHNKLTSVYINEYTKINVRYRRIGHHRLLTNCHVNEQYMHTLQLKLSQQHNTFSSLDSSNDSRDEFRTHAGNSSVLGYIDGWHAYNAVLNF